MSEIWNPRTIRTMYKKEDQGDADEAALFGDDREDEVGVGLREIEELLHPVPDPHAQGAAGPEGDQRLDDLKTGMAGVLPGIEEGHEPGQAVALVDEEPDGDGDKQGGDPRKMDDPAAGQIDHHEGDDGDDHGRPEIGLEQDQPHHDAGNGQRDEQAPG